MRPLNDARRRLVDAIGGNVDLLAQVEAELCEDQRTVMLYVPDGAGWWHAAYFDLTERTEFIDEAAIESAVKHGLH